MTITPHVLTGAALATQTNSSVVAFLLGVAAHYILDAIPHVDPGTFLDPVSPHKNRKLDMATIHDKDKPWPKWLYAFVIIEFAAMVAVVSLFKNRLDFGIIVAGAFGGIFVDVLDNPFFRWILSFPVLKQIHWLHHRLHYDLEPKYWQWGLLTEIIIIIGSFWLLRKG